MLQKQRKPFLELCSRNLETTTRPLRSALMTFLTEFHKSISCRFYQPVDHGTLFDIRDKTI